MSSVGDMLDELEWPSLESRREQSSLTFFYKIHSGMVYVDKDKYLTPVTGLRQTQASHDSQYRRYQAYSDALKNSFFPRTIPQWNNLPSPVVSVQTTEEFKSLTNKFVQRHADRCLCLLIVNSFIGPPRFFFYAKF